MSKFKIKEYLADIIHLHTKGAKLGSDKIAKVLIDRYKLSNDAAALGRSVRNLLGKEGYGKGEKIEDSEHFKNAKKNKVKLGKKTYFITSAQNATPIHKEFLENIEKYAAYHKAELIIIPLRYKNPTSVFTDKQKRDNLWAEETLPYLMANRIKISDRFTVLGDIKIQLTAAQPLTTMEGFTEGESAIIGHPRMHFKTLHTLPSHSNKYLMTSGAVTVPNYTDSKSGKKGEFHHTLGFTIIETDGKDLLHIRQVSADDNGNFCDLDYIVEEDEVRQSNEYVDALIGGDVHVGSTCPVTHECTLKMLRRFNPKNYVIHDLVDGYSVNPHERKDPFIALSREEDGTWDFRKELHAAFEYVDQFLEWNPVFVKDNHGIFIDRFLVDSDWRKERNKKSYLKYAYLKSEGQLPNGVIPYELEKRYGEAVTCLTEDSSFIINNNELANHGHLGASGSRGSVMQFKRLNIKVVTAHTHSPELIDGAMCVGTQTHLQLSYTKGMGKWAHANGIIHRNGKRQLILMEEGEYTNFK